ncbi:MAG: hypothetical protein HQ580_14680 [Planctomycetes bacterium]|nr:hypothetical protein [Planctomycetota bacterium]
MCRKLISTKKAGAIFDGDPAGRKKLHRQRYQSPTSLSTKKYSKIVVGQALLFGEKENEGFWPVFEVLLRRAI